MNPSLSLSFSPFIFLLDYFITLFLFKGEGAKAALETFRSHLSELIQQQQYQILYQGQLRIKWGERNYLIHQLRGEGGNEKEVQVLQLPMRFLRDCLSFSCTHMHIRQVEAISTPALLSVQVLHTVTEFKSQEKWEIRFTVYREGAAYVSGGVSSNIL